MFIMKIEKDKQRNEQNYQIKKKIRKLTEKETYKNLGILEVDTNKQAEMKEKIRKKDEQESFWKPNSVAEIL